MSGRPGDGGWRDGFPGPRSGPGKSVAPGPAPGRSEGLSAASPPAPGEFPATGRRSPFSTVGSPPEGARYAWSARLYETGAAPRDLSPENPGSQTSRLDLPYVSGEARLEISLDLKDTSGRRLDRTTGSYPVTNHADVRLIDPAPGSTLIAGDPSPFQAQARDHRGDTLDPAAIHVELRREGEAWIPARIEGGTLIAPESPGSYELRLSADEGLNTPDGAPRIRQRAYRIIVATSPAPYGLSLGFGPGPERDWREEKTRRHDRDDERRPNLSPLLVACEERSQGDSYAPAPSGKEYGFSENHAERIRRFTAVLIPRGAYWGRDREETYIALAPDEVFTAAVGTGRRAVRLLVGPLDGRSSYRVLVNDEEITITTDRGGPALYELELETQSPAGIMSIRSPDEIGLVGLWLKDLGPNSPPESLRIREREDVKILRHDRPWDWDEPWKQPGGGQGQGEARRPRDWDENQEGIYLREWNE